MGGAIPQLISLPPSLHHLIALHHEITHTFTHTFAGVADSRLFYNAGDGAAY
jgi:hypothetical protein